MSDLISLEKDPRLFLYTSLTAGSSHIVTATSRLETILRANKIPFQAIDLATDEQAKKLWQRRGGKRKLPGLVKEGFVLGDLNEVEEWNEFGELRENIGPVPASNAAPPKGGPVGIQTAPGLSHNVTSAPPAGSASAKHADVPAPVAKSQGIALPGAAEIAARGKKVATGTAAAVKGAVIGGPTKVDATNERLEESRKGVEPTTEPEESRSPTSEKASTTTSIPIQGGPAKVAATAERLNETPAEPATHAEEMKTDSEKPPLAASIRGGPAKIAAISARMEEAKEKKDVESATKSDEAKVDTEKEKGSKEADKGAEIQTQEPNAAAKDLKIGEPPFEDVAKSSEPAQKPVEAVVEKTDSESTEADDALDVPTRTAEVVESAEPTEEEEVGEERGDEPENAKEKTEDDIPEANAAAKELKIGEPTTEEAAIASEKAA